MRNAWGPDARRSARNPRAAASVALLALIALTLSAAPTTAQEGSTAPGVRIRGSCRALEGTDEAALSTLQLGGFGLDVEVTMPSTVDLGAPARVAVSLSYDLLGTLADGARQIGLETVDVTGSELPITVHGPSGPQTRVLLPSPALIDARKAGRVGLGSVDFDVPTDVPGAIQVSIGTSTIRFRTSPDGLSGSARCDPGPSLLLPLGFILDPLAPRIDPSVRELEGPSVTVDLSEDVLDGSGPLVDDSWEVVRTTSNGTAEFVSPGVLAATAGQGTSEVVWQVCGLQGEPPSDGPTDEASVQVGAGNSATAPPTSAPAGEDSETHCAQGVLRVTGKQVDSQVLSTSESTGGTPGEAPATVVGDAAPLSVTG